MKYFFQILAIIVLIIIIYTISSPDLRTGLITHIIITFSTLIFTDLGYKAFSNRKYIILMIKLWRLSSKNEYIRFSMSYQYRIKVNDKYLLVKNSNWNFYQHVGGKYKRTKSTHKVLKDLEATDDTKLPTTGLMKDDLAVFIPAKNACKFLKWFDKRQDREISHWREFHEELLNKSILPQNIFPYVNYELVKSLRLPLRKSPRLNCWEIIHYDILDLHPTDEQCKELEKLMKEGDSNYIKWADLELIKCLGHDPVTKVAKYRIGEHTKWVINGRYS